MNNKKVQKQYLDKIKRINKYNKYYYEKSEPIVTDVIYDKLKKEIFNLEEEHRFLKSKNSPSNTVGYKPSKTFKKVFNRISKW